MRIFIVVLLLVSGSAFALDNIPDNEMALCKVKSNDFAFLCHLNTTNHSTCEFVIGTKFDLPNCKPCDNTTPVVTNAPIKPTSTGNPLLDLFRKY